jgi:hypothetical protein
MSKNSTEFSQEETQRRMEAALRGARIAGPKPNETLTPTSVKARRKKRKKVKSDDASDANE